MAKNRFRGAGGSRRGAACELRLLLRVLRRSTGFHRQNTDPGWKSSQLDDRSRQRRASLQAFREPDDRAVRRRVQLVLPPGLAGGGGAGNKTVRRISQSASGVCSGGAAGSRKGSFSTSVLQPFPRAAPGGKEKLSPGKLQGRLRSGVRPPQPPGPGAAAAAGGRPGPVLWAGRLGAVGQGRTAALARASLRQLESPPLVSTSSSDSEYACVERSVTRWLRHSGDPRASPGPAAWLGSSDKGPTRLRPPKLSGHEPWQCHTGPWKAEVRQKGARSRLRAGARCAIQAESAKGK